MSKLSDVLDRCMTQMRESPVASDTDMVVWLNTGILKFSQKAKWLDGLVIIPMKADVAQYLLPADHIATTGAYYDETLLQRCSAYDAQLVSPTTPVYYYEDDWEDEASRAVPAEFAIHALWEPLWPLQFIHSQNSLGRRTITLVAAPAADGGYAFPGSPIVGHLEGTVDADSIYWADEDGLVYAVDSTDGNLMMFYKKTDVLPNSTTDVITWNDVLGVCYAAEALSLAMGTEDDEYDRYRAWVYENIATNASNILASMSINKRIH